MDLKFEVIQVNDEGWNETVKTCLDYDFYHTAIYHKIEGEDHTPLLFVAKSDQQTIAFPLLIRSIDNSSSKDATSVYGYCGPIASVSFESLDPLLISFFKKHLLEYFDSNSIIAAFSRLHPLIHTHDFFENFGNKISLNKTVAIDLGLSVDEQRRKFRKSNKSELNQLRRKGVTVKDAASENDIKKFIAIYEETMRRVNATEMYFFPEQYYFDFIKNSEFSSKLLLAELDGEIIAGAIFTVTGNIMQYHLAGTIAEYSRLTPMKLILDEARLLANELNLQFLHLGGGVGGSDEDSLFRFKSGFSDHYCQFYIWKYIHNTDTYRSLVAQKGLENEDSSYFPLYRLKKE